MTLEVIVAAALTVFAAVVLVQVVMAAYVQGVARAAADEAVRTGSRVDAGVEVCRQRAGEVFATLLPGPLGGQAFVDCTADGSMLVSTVTVDVESPTPGLPTFTITATGRATQEGAGG